MLSKNSLILQRRLSSRVSPIEISTLSNGLRIVTDSNPGHFSALGAYVNTGSRHETNKCSGISHMLDVMAWKSTNRRSGVQMMEDLAKLGGNYMCGAQRELIIYQSSVFNKDTEKMFECIAETIKEPKLSEAEFEEAKLTGAYELEELSHKHDMLLPEVLHEAAYSKQSLGMPIHGTIESLNRLSVGDVRQFHETYYSPKNVVLAMVGVDHLQAVKMAENYLGGWQEVARANDVTKPLAQYQGGEISLPYQEPRFSNLPKLVHMQIAFETEGLLSHDLYALATLQKLLGGGLSFSAGGPGKGMFLRLFKVLNQYPFVENCMAFNHAHSDSGLFGITISCYAEHAEYMAQVACHEFAKVMESNSSRDSISHHEFKRAKNQLISSLLMNVESKLAALEDIGRQVQCQGKVTSVDEMVQKIQALDIADVQAVAQKVFGGNGNGSRSGRPSVVMQGERSSIGDVEFVLKHFGLGR
ncbi:LuxS/MPP-like metallohydrolase [Metschnikowia bicuspidata var. bicuspidata NRRL YB-4993]|uniref:LuxS/MPP-like metallohydrolase n=1 Tax=Metschnikowia bicuspidata var. bicuspidata NRRL YB-4993 TaxID=869754 RepID=A0A1A0HE62_9ASCO|nr:LuxS/MPP-like metallohydrolase [Metschnikowia bicuspidata var. bicuspidata NRRL YB-4993]OBA22193.1 LuxS/MPP-like metallohydrolase [Metschnikowia bicuspidata var. bicuspidata NRRL YB-4993]